ncbi:Auxin efflux carrier [Cynara cardunculus var. scolymus]|uniref:Auxin efflux carrier component n=1 Tax=Cynara cardunculus var. scolymus TaxID=59895 RepID=A0A103YHA4_CYNCS|nr:Auxin efflux carrier [Cynara cardunculus var. scolymus]
MISLNDAYHILAATIPLYVAMILAYISVKWLKLFNPDQCSGINKFVAKFSIPLLSFQVISKSNPYKMNLKLIYADVLQKVIVLVGAAIITKVRSNGHLNWIITGFSLSTLPNTLILGIPLLKSMYGDEADVLLAQIIALQSLIWYNLLLFLFELSNARDAHMIQLSAATGMYFKWDSEARQEAQGIDKREETNSRTLRRTKIMLLLLTVGKKLLMNPNSYATIAGLAWASISFRCNIKLPKVVENSISILSDGGLGMAMFSLGLFMASQANIVACGKRLALLAMVLKFIVGPVMVVPSIVFGLKGVPFKIAVIQAALPQGIVPFVFANEYNVHPDILSTGITVGLLVALPIALVYYLLLGL